MEIDYLTSSIDYGNLIKARVFLNKMSFEDAFHYRNLYDYFLMQKPKPWMFVPCKEVNGEWLFLEEPENFLDYQDVYNSCEKDSNLHAWYNDCSQYEKAKDKCLFEGFRWNVAQFCDEPMVEIESEHLYLVYDCEDGTFQNENEVFFETVEDILKVKVKLKLTDAAKKRINP